MKSPQYTQKEKAVEVDKRLDDLDKQPLPEYKTARALQNMDSAMKAAKEARGQKKQE